MDRLEAQVLVVLRRELPAAIVAENALHAHERQTLTMYGTLTGGTFTLEYDGAETGNIAYNATAATVQSALEALSTIRDGDVFCSGGPMNTADVTIDILQTEPPLLIADSAGLLGSGSPEVVITAESTVAPSVVSWDRGIPAEDITPEGLANLPRVSVGCYEDRPLHDDPDDEQEWNGIGGKIERSVAVVTMLRAPSIFESHVRLLRLSAAIQAVLRAHVNDNMLGKASYWPFLHRVLIDPPIYAGDSGYLSVGTIIVSRARVVEAA